MAISVPKTGSTTLHYALMAGLDQPFHTRSEAPDIYHMTASDLRMIMGPGAFGDYYCFGVVRNPYDRLVSLFHDFHDQRGCIRTDCFADFLRYELVAWLEDVHFKPQTFFLSDTHGHLIPSEVFRFEEGIATIVSTLGSRMGFVPKQIGHARRSDRRHWQSYYGSADLRAIVQEHYAEDFRVFGYALDEDLTNTPAA